MMTEPRNSVPQVDGDVAVNSTDWLPPYRAICRIGSLPPVIDNTTDPRGYPSASAARILSNGTANSKGDDDTPGFEPSGSTRSENSSPDSKGNKSGI